VIYWQILELWKRNVKSSVLALPEDYPYRLETLRHLVQLQLHLEMRQNKTKDLEEIIMNLSPIYDEWHAKTIAEGEKVGEKRGDLKARLEIVRQLLGENMPVERISALTRVSIDQIQKLQAEN
jgi:predicted transposase YdaD